MVWRQAATRNAAPSAWPAAHPTARAVPGSCRQPPVPGPTSGRSRGRSITLAATAVAGRRCSACPSADGRPTRGRRLPSAATVTGQVGLDRRRSTHPRSPARAHHRAGLGGLGAFERTRQDDAEAGVHRLFIPPIRSNLSRAWCAEQGKGPASARAGYSASLARRQDPSLVAAWPPGSPGSPDTQHVAWAQSADGHWLTRRTSDGRRPWSWLPAGWLSTSARK